MEKLLNENEQYDDFSGEQIASFKRYIEENDVFNDNVFEVFEKNLDYYASRYTRDEFVSYAELFHANSDFWNSDEMDENINLYEVSVDWRNKTVHPHDSEYVIKEEKYVFIDSFSDKIKKILNNLNKKDIELYSSVDLIFYVDGSLYQYLPKKNFVFTWEKNGKNLIDKISKILSMDLTDKIVIIPIFIPIRKMLFLGEYGYRESLIDYGRILSLVEHSTDDSKIIRRFESRYINEKFRIDSVEKSIISIITC
ncbi:hypothetical protein JNO63_05990 [Anaerococcus sp. mt242]|uniref:hypothetical protein n=1 Tax=Anaerococcus sp. mt242 TaxID=2661917 RepID=UPI0019330D6D|nr:hypothetical protein [Anaerococcus sp. mt242]MBM0046639.1 hypothetical protein [Anaerococcus sp. mt242]